MKLKDYEVQHAELALRYANSIIARTAYRIAIQPWDVVTSYAQTDIERRGLSADRIEDACRDILRVIGSFGSPWRLASKCQHEVKPADGCSYGGMAMQLFDEDRVRMTVYFEMDCTWKP